MSHPGGATLARAALEKLNHILENLDPQQVEATVQAISAALVDALTNLLDPDGQEQARVLKEVARVLGEKQGHDPITALSLAAHLIVPDEAELHEQLHIQPPDPQDLVRAEASMLAVKANYQLREDRSAQAILEIYLDQDGSPVRHRVETILAWEELPDVIREARLRERRGEFSFSLYPPTPAVPAEPAR